MNFRISTVAAPVRHQIVERLRTAIIECEFEPGGRLVERELCDLMGVSRSSIRESLRQLEAEGLVTMIPNTGPQVAKLDDESTKQIYEIRAALEGMAARLFIERAGPEGVVALERAVNKMVERFANGNKRAMRRAWSEFYDVLEAGCRNEVLSRQLILLRARAAFVRTLLSNDRIAESLAELQSVVSAIKKRDVAKAERLSIAHIDSAATAAHEILRSLNDAALK